MKYSVNKKLNSALNQIEEDLLDMGLAEIQRYMANFPKEVDYNIVQYGNLLIYYEDVRQLYRDAGYKSLDKKSDDAIWTIYKKQVGFVAKQLIKNNK